MKAPWYVEEVALPCHTLVSEPTPECPNRWSCTNCGAAAVADGLWVTGSATAKTCDEICDAWIQLAAALDVMVVSDRAGSGVAR